MKVLTGVKALLAAAVAAAGLAVFAEPCVEITKAWQANPGSGVVDFTCEVRDTGASAYDLIVRVEAKGCDTTFTFTNENVQAGSTTTSVDYKSHLGGVYPNVSVYASLAYRSAMVPTDENGFDYTTDGVTFLPGDYCVVDLATGNETMMLNVTDPSIFNTDEYKTTKMAFRYVPEGKFKTNFGRTGSDNRIKVDAELSAYWISIFHLTRAQYAVIMGGTFSDVMCPLSGNEYTWNSVRGGSWNGTSGAPASNTFVGKLNARCEGKYDFCTALQWERAARAGTRTDYFFGVNQGSVTDQLLDPYAWYGKNTTSFHDVGTKKFNAWGIEPYGNVYDACLDWQEANDSELVQSKIVKDYAGAAAGSVRVARGGDIWGSLAAASSVHRYFKEPDQNGGGIGFRLVRKVK